MTVEKMIKELQKYNPKAQVKTHHPKGLTALFVLQRKDEEDVVFIEDANDNDMREELSAQFEHASEVQMDELDFFMNLLEIGITLDDIKTFLPEQYLYSKTFLEEHGLI